MMPEVYYKSHFSQDAEKALISAPLEEDFFANTKLNRYLATYPNAPFESKDQIVSDLMKGLWEQGQLFEVFRAFDVFLAVSGKRGHFVHQFEVFILGFNLILCIREKVPDLSALFEESDLYRIFYTWLMTSSAHDLGYPIESSSKIMSKLAELYSSLGLKNIVSQLENLELKKIIKSNPDLGSILAYEEDGVSELEINVGSLVLSSILNSTTLHSEDGKALQTRLLEEDDHGYASSILLCQNIANELSKDRNYDQLKNHWVFTALKKSIGAMALHTLKLDDCIAESDIPYIEKIDFNKNPYAYLLFVIDNLQDWNRTLFRDPQFPDYSLQEFTRNSDGIHIRYHVSHDSWPTKTIDRIRDEIEKKQKMLDLLIGPADKIGIKIKVEFDLSCGGDKQFVELEM